jgi:uncharacterized protein HemX
MGNKEGRRFSFPRTFLGFLVVFLVFSWCFLGAWGFGQKKTKSKKKTKRKQKENKKKTKRKPKENQKKTKENQRKPKKTKENQKKRKPPPLREQEGKD